jgi:sec-independent protein translocase protein TatB
MPQVGPLELLVIAMVALIVFGPEKLPRMARQAGRYASELRRMANNVRDEFESSLTLDDDDDDDVIVAPEESPEGRRSTNQDARVPPDAHPDDEPDEAAKDKPSDPDETEH